MERKIKFNKLELNKDKTSGSCNIIKPEKKRKKKMKAVKRSRISAPPVWFTTYMTEFRKDFKKEIEIMIDTKIEKAIKKALTKFAIKNNLKS
ncbi:MAG: hypothetical protein LBV53_02035 [Mycoplasmataceae bacterium]|jgi:hypothetical protein|nr:hypothetical protein [Mycoplasmataceae bacterium]